MDVVRHKAICPYFNTATGRPFRQQVYVFLVISIVKEGFLHVGLYDVEILGPLFVLSLS
jgi:hypothetical protein